MISKILFDMDGVLTEPRKKLTTQVRGMLLELLGKGFEVGIITGSNYEYIIEQTDLCCEGLTLYPCNGTQVWNHIIKDKKSFWKQTYSMELDKKERAQITRDLSKLHAQLMPIIAAQTKITKPNGETIQHRPGMINFCPIGRSATQKERKTFQNFDEEYSFREVWLSRIRDILPMNYIIVLGGVTSFDIYPQGWDKTYTLNHVKYNAENPVIFIGNSFFKNGNDECMLTQKNVVCIKVDSPEDTVEVMNNFVKE